MLTDYLSDLLMSIFFNFNFNLAVTVLSTVIFLFNVLVLRLKKNYYAFGYKSIPLFLIIPGINVAFLLVNILYGMFNVSGYAVRKKRIRKPISKISVARKIA